MTFKIKEGHHYSSTLALGLFYNKKSIKRLVKFNGTTRYRLDPAFQGDTNKLFGLSYTLNPMGDSARFGWRYNPANDMVVLTAFCHINGVMTYKDIENVSIGDWITCELVISNSTYHFIVTTPNAPFVTESIPFTHTHKFSYLLRPYFGGTQVAPKDILLDINKI